MRQKYILSTVVLLVAISVFLLVYNLKNKTPEIILSDISPNPLAETINIQDALKLTFENISEEEKTKTDVFISPKIDFTGEWENFELKLVPDSYWKPGEIYTAILYIDNSYFTHFSFLVVNDDSLTKEEKDLIYNQEINTLADKYAELYADKPWLEDLPIIADQYIIIYDFDNQRIRIRLLKTENLSPEEITFYKEKGIAEIVKIGVPEETDVEFIFD